MGDVGSRRWCRETLPHRVWGIRKHFLPGHVKCHVCVCQEPNGTFTMWAQRKASGPKQRVFPRPDMERCKTYNGPAGEQTSVTADQRGPWRPQQTLSSFITCVLGSQYLREAFPCGSAWQRRTRAPHFGPTYQMHHQLPSLNGGWCSGFHGQTYPLTWPIFGFSTSTDLTRLIVTKSDQKWMIRKSKHQKYKNKNKNRKREFVIRILCPIFSDIEARKSYVVDSYWYRKNGIFIYKENGHSLKSYPLLILYEISTDSININVITRSVRLYEIIMRILMFSTRILMLFTHWLWCPSQIFYSKGGVCQQWAIFSVCK